MESKLKINGQDHNFESEKMPSTVSDLLKELDIDAATVVAEIDGNIIERKDFADTVLANGQSIELIRFVGGG